MSRTVDQATIAKNQHFQKNKDQTNIKFYLHKQSENPWGATKQDLLLFLTLQYGTMEVVLL